MRFKSMVLLVVILLGTFVVIDEAAHAAKKPVTQGQYAVALVQDLGLEKEPSVTEAIELLEKLGVEPDKGWDRDKEMTSELVLQVYHRLVDAIEDGELDLTIGELEKIIRKLSIGFGLALPAKLPRPSGRALAPAPSTIGLGDGGGSVSE